MYRTKSSLMPSIIASNMSKPSRCHSASGSLLAHGPEVDALAQVVHLVEVLAPVLVDHREHHPALDLAQRAPRRSASSFASYCSTRVAVQQLEDRFGLGQLRDLLARDAHREDVLGLRAA